jgi:hypothetical protein
MSKTTTQPAQIQNRIVGHGEEAPDQLLANPKNWRIHPENQQQGLTTVLELVGWVQSVIVNRRTGFLVDGHLRVSLAMRRGEAKVPVAYVDLTEEEEALILATLDPLASLAVTDQAQIRALIEDVERDDSVDNLLAGFGFAFDGEAPTSQDQGGKTKEIDPNDFQLGHRCPRCGFEFEESK